MPTLALTLPFPVTATEDSISIEPKTLSGLEEYARLWDGDMVLVATRTEHTGMAGTTCSMASLPFDVTLTPDRISTLRDINPDVVLTDLTVMNREIPHLHDAMPVVIIVENPLRARLQWAHSNAHSHIDAARQAFGLIRKEPHMRSTLRKAAGLQLNGRPAAEAYGRVNPSYVMYYDTRVRRNDVRGDAHTDSDVFRLAFSGRWLYPKGFDAALEAFRHARELTRRPLELHLFGGGALADLVDDSDPSIINQGMVDFSEEWMPFFQRDIDLAVLPHRQSDPAGTYLEAAGCGVPFLSYKNLVSDDLAKEGLGWTVRMNDIAALAARIAQLADHPEMLEQPRQTGIKFMLEHSMEAEFQKRIDHLARCAQGEFTAS